MDVTKTLARHAAELCYEDIPEQVIALQKQSVADAICTMAAATGLSEQAMRITRFAEGQHQAGNCVLLGSAHKTNALLAALANGALAHALDYEDSHELAMVHPNASSTPSFLAMAQERGIGGRKILTALVAASDICCRLDLGVRTDLLKHGWYMPPIHGAMGATMGAGNLLGLDEAAIADALALTMTQVTCSGQAAVSPYSAVRTIREGFAAHAVVLSTKLAEEGVVARFDDALEGSLGYYHAYARGDYDPQAVLHNLGQQFMGAGVSFKPWPACRASHTVIEGVKRLVEEHGLKANRIREIRLVLHEVGRMLLEPREVKYNVETPDMAKMSLPFLVGTILKYGDIDLGSFTNERLADRDILVYGNLVTYQINTALDKSQNKHTQVSIHCVDGAEATVELRDALGSRQRPMSDWELFRKYQDCMQRSIKHYSLEAIQTSYECIHTLEVDGNLERLLALLYCA